MMNLLNYTVNRHIELEKVKELPKDQMELAKKINHYLSSSINKKINEDERKNNIYNVGDWIMKFNGVWKYYEIKEIKNNILFEF